MSSNDIKENDENLMSHKSSQLSLNTNSPATSSSYVQADFKSNENQTNRAFESIRSRSSSNRSATGTASKTSPTRIKPNSAESVSHTNNKSENIPIPQTPGPNSKLPPIRNPKSKIIMKNIQTKQQLLQKQQSELKNNESESNSNDQLETTLVPNPPESKSVQQVKIQRSISSSNLEKRFELNSR